MRHMCDRGAVQEIPTGQGNRVRAEIYGLHEQQCNNAQDLLQFFDFCFNQRSTASTNMNATSSRSHALFTITVRRVVVSVGDGVDKHLRAMVRTEGIESKLHLVDLAGASYCIAPFIASLFPSLSVQCNVAMPCCLESLDGEAMWLSACR